MLHIKNNRVVFEYSYCQQCGLCKAICPKQAISFERNKEGLNIVEINQDTCIKCKLCIRLCPANSNSVSPNYKEIIKNRIFYLGYHNNKQIRYHSSSGGVTRAIAIECLQKKLVDGVYMLRKTSEFPFAEGYLYTPDNIPEYNEIPNSIYHSVPLNENIKKIQGKKILIIGTSCQIKSAYNYLKRRTKELYCICIFCKQQKTIRSTQFIAKMLRTSISIDSQFSFQYRGNGWPGSVFINQKSINYSTASSLPFGKRLWSVPGCHICGDPYAIDYADLTLMDPWNILKDEKDGCNLIVCHSEKGKELLKATSCIHLKEQTFSSVEKGLSLKDIERKQLLIPFYLHKPCSMRIKLAGYLDLMQRFLFTFLLEKLPSMPIVFYKIINKIPDIRNLILK